MTKPTERIAREAIGGVATAVVAVFVIARARDFVLFGPGRLPRGVIFGADSALYLRDARASLWSSQFWAARQKLGGGGPFPFLLLVKVARYHVAAVVILQGLLWVSAFRYLANSTQARLRRAPTRLAAVVVVWLLAIAAPLVQWTAAFATEALSVAVAAVAIGAALRWADRPDRRRSAVLAAALVAAALTRDTNALLVVAVAAGLVIAATTRRVPWRPALTIAIVALAGSGTALALANQARRWYYPLRETAVLRLQSDATAGPYLRARGYPQTGAVTRLPARYAAAGDAVDTAPEYASLRAWLDRDGRRTYSRFLVTHPRWVLATAWGDRAAILMPDVGGYARVFGVAVARVSKAAAALAVPGRWWWFWLRAIVVAALVAAALVAGRRDRSSRWWAAVLGPLALLWLLHALAAFHGDALEVDRHELTAMLQLQLVVWLAAIAAVDVLLDARRTDSCAGVERGRGAPDGTLARDAAPDPV